MRTVVSILSEGVPTVSEFETPNFTQYCEVYEYIVGEVTPEAEII